ncbi:sulfate adenylyltransferase subunit CysN [Tepidamorphus sp. 3E244]|uniref:sulfate adenylyltransferase subunit CysN n=1 Tax=Tepidamorphus sp. 3E244 TaxID=3385498 RepID=UPI0038FC4BD3
MLPAPEISQLRIVTCGSVDDGKSTLIGRILHDCQALLDDQVEVLKRDSATHGTAGDDFDFALLLDGLEAEREQGITIDVAYRYFATPKRRFIVADTPGHVQYTRNMATGASTADVAILLVDARKGLLEQTFRHARIVSLLGIRHVVLAVNKMDLVGFDQARFEDIAAEFMALGHELAFKTIQPVPLCARGGDNVAAASPHTPWYGGPTLIGHLESLDVTSMRAELPFRFPVQWVNRPDADFRGFAGTLAGGRVSAGDDIVVANSGKPAKIARIVSFDGDLEGAEAGDAVTLVLDREIDISRGDLLCPPGARSHVADQFSAHLVWMGEEDLLASRRYRLKAGRQSVSATITDIKHAVDVSSGQKLAAKSLGLNAIGVVNVSTAQPIAFDPYAENRVTGSFILIDRFTNQTVGAGMIDFPLRRALNVHLQDFAIDRDARARLKDQKPAVLWFTGLSGAGKSTIADRVEKRLFALGAHTYTLDGDNVRHGLNRDLGFTDADRVENIRRVAEVAKLMGDAGLIVMVSFISPFRAERRMARDMMGDIDFIEVHVATPLKVAEERDPKGLYAKARSGQLKNFTGIDSPYEPPENAELVLDTVGNDLDTLADMVVDTLRNRGLLGN